jgi:hypothetical protein
MLAQLLLRGDPKKAFNEYQAVLKNAPKRFNATYGGAIAARASGDTMRLNFSRSLCGKAHYLVGFYSHCFEGISGDP